MKKNKDVFWKVVLIVVFFIIIIFLALAATDSWIFADKVKVETIVGVMKETEDEGGKTNLEVSKVSELKEDVSKEVENIDMPPGAIPLGDGKIVGYTYPLGMKGPWKQSVPEGGFVLVACGNCTVDGIVATSDGTEGNVFQIDGSTSDGSTPGDLNKTIVIKDYALGHVQVTFIYAGNEDSKKATMSAVSNMFKAPNCGQEGCLGGVTLYSSYSKSEWTSEIFSE